jgi:hypothetical protein
VKWLVDFYNQARSIVARYDVEAPSPPAAVVAGRRVLRAAYPPSRAPSRPTLFQQAERIGGQDDSGWVLYRIVKIAS